MVLLPVVVDLGKVIKTAERSHDRVFHEGDFRLCGYTDTESDPARLGGNSPISPMGACGHSFSRAEQPLEHHSTSQQRFFPHGAALNRGVLPLLSDPLIHNSGLLAMAA